MRSWTSSVRRSRTYTAVDGQSSRGCERRRFVVPRRFFSSTRRARAFADGRVGTRARGGARSASARRLTRRAIARSRLSACVRPADDVTRIRPRASSRVARRCVARVRCALVSDGDCATSKNTSTRVERLFTFCPPGPLARENRKTSSDIRMRAAPTRRTLSGSVMRSPNDVRARRLPRQSRIRPASRTGRCACLPRSAPRSLPEG